MRSGRPQPEVQTPGKHSAASKKERADWRNERAGLKSDGYGNGGGLFRQNKKEGGMETDGKEGDRGEGISQGAGPPASITQHTGVWFTSPSLAMHLGPNGERCQDELGQHGCREHLHPAEDKCIRRLLLMHNQNPSCDMKCIEQQPFCFEKKTKNKTSPHQESAESCFSYPGFISL